MHVPRVLVFESVAACGTQFGRVRLHIWSNGVQNSIALHTRHNFSTEATPRRPGPPEGEGRTVPSRVIQRRCLARDQGFCPRHVSGEWSGDARAARIPQSTLQRYSLRKLKATRAPHRASAVETSWRKTAPLPAKGV